MLELLISGSSDVLGVGGSDILGVPSEWSDQRASGPNCPECCPSCIIDFDDFEDATIGAQWSVVSGTWAEASGSLSTSSSGAEIRNTTSHPDNEEQMYVEASVTVTNGSVVDIFVNRLDGSNSYFGRFTLSSISATVQVYSRVAGVNTLLETSLSNNLADFRSKTLKVCMTTHGIIASVAGNGETIVAAAAVTAHAGGYQFSLGLSSGSVDYHSVSFEKHGELHEGCKNCGGECTECCDPVIPPFGFYRVDLGVGGWTDARCNLCNEILGEYIVDQFEPCHWRYSVLNYCNLDVSVCNLCGSTAHFTIDLELVGTAPDCKWQITVKLVSNIVDPGCGPPCTTTTQAVYESAELVDDQQCQTLPVTLNRISQVGIAGGVVSHCGGSLPATITLEAAA